MSSRFGIGEERGRYRVRPFDGGQGCQLLEVHPRASAQGVMAGAAGGKNREALIEHLESSNPLPVTMDPAIARYCRESAPALDAVLAARAAAVAVVTGEVQKTPEQLMPGAGDRILREGWIYGLGGPPS